MAADRGRPGPRKPFRPARRVWTIASILALGGALCASPARAQATTERASVSSGSAQSNGFSIAPAISGDGRFVAFHSAASNLVPDDTNGLVDVFVHDRTLGITERASVSSEEVQANAPSQNAAISGDGRFVVFESPATNLVPGDTNASSDIFLRDRWNGTTTRISVGPGGAQANSSSSSPDISADGRFVAFHSSASNLVGPLDTNNTLDVFVHERETGITTRVSVNSQGVQGNGISTNAALSADGRFVAFQSIADNLVAGDTNLRYDIFVHDRLLGATERVSVSSGGTQANDNSVFAAIGADGRFVGFESFASNLVPGDANAGLDVFVHDRETGTTERASVSSDGAEGDAGSRSAALSADGRFVAFDSSAANLAPDDTNGRLDVFVRDRQAGTTERVSVSSEGTQGNGHAGTPAVSADGRFVAFFSGAANLVPDDTNNAWDVFVRDRLGLSIDVTPPVLSVPAEVVADATACSGATVAYQVTATDDVDPAPAVSCDPPPGSLFPMGTTLVSCSATDASGNTATAAFNVTVRGAIEQTQDLVAAVNALNLPDGISRALLAKLANVSWNSLTAFTNQLRALTGSRLTAEQAAALAAAARRLQALLGGSESCEPA